MPQLSSRFANPSASSDPFLQSKLNAWRNPYNPTSNPTGFIDLTIAENSFSIPSVAARLATVPPLPESNLSYGQMFGSLSTRSIVASYLQHHHTHHNVNPDHLILANSVGSLIDALITIICNPTDAVLTFAPGYRGHAIHISARQAARLITAKLDPIPDENSTRNEFSMPISTTVLQTAWENAGGQNSNIRVLLVDSPHNPTGEVLSPSVISDLIEWARQHDMHIIFDEVYANSVHDPTQVFHSAADVLQGDLDDDVHILWGVSKDFCSAGMRLAVLQSQSTVILSALQLNFSLFSAPSRYVEWVVGNILNDRQWTQRFITDNCSQLRLGFDRCVAYLETLGIGYVVPAAGFFILVDFRPWLKENSEEGEVEFWRRLYDCRVMISPGQECLSGGYGWFRVCFAAVDAKTLQLAWLRLQQTLSSSA